ncbi:MAG: cytochrome c3 family protein [Candidatus Marinimicrobia bacterium]|nr:cytochrome c3 family protein [Candidatus Neomarinimicrobiota bacterium]
MIIRTCLTVLVLAFAVCGQIEQELLEKSKIAFTPHNFFGKDALAGSDSTVQDYTLCRQCHTPSKMAPVEALWYRKEAIKDFNVEKVVDSGAGELLPAEANSRSCLFCHDGSMAPGFHHRQTSPHQQVSLLGGDGLRNKNHNLHLFAFPENDLETHLPSSDSPLVISETGAITCVTCHDPHNNERGDFLRIEAEASQICFDCHEMANWELSTHGNPADPRFSAMSEMACAACHDIHAVPPTANLLTSDENTLCLSCHDGSADSDQEVASETDLEAVFDKTFSHPIRWNSPGVAQAEPMDNWSSGLAGDRSVSCSDCHNPHAASDHTHSPFIDGSQIYVPGVDSRGFSKAISDYEYETCYKCHGMNQNATFGNNVGLLFARTNMSFHPIEAPGNNPFVPSLKPEWSEQSMLQCSDCHGNDDPLGTKGPHGSNIPHILKASYTDFPFASLEENQLCFRCHEEQRVVQSNGFKFHQLHIQDAGYACSACHDPHGSIEYPGLIDLNASFIQPLNGVLAVVRTEPGHGSCTLRCHDKAHPSQSY